VDVAEVKQSILIVEDDLDVADMLNAYFRVQGYDVLSASMGEEAVKLCQKKFPDLVILDIRLPDFDGYEVARRLRNDRHSREIPIIFLTDKRNRQDRLQGLELGADDYVTKPFDIQELRLRVRNALRRSSQGTLTNPVTNLPEGVLIDEKLSDCLHSDDWALLLISLVNMEFFREAYGFVASDDVLRAVSLMIHNALREAGTSTDFIGQYSPTKFVLVTQPVRLAELKNRITTRLDQTLDFFYPLKDRSQKEYKGKRLLVRMQELSAEKGPFTNLKALKAALEG
jgi:PleD family two-component response regulator